MQAPLTHAGGVVWREGEPGRQYLLVRSSDGAHWVLPKGHIEVGEGPEQAALRELREEAGVIGVIDRSLGVWSFRQGAETVRVVYYLVHQTGKVPALESRKQRWCPLAEAIEQMEFEEPRQALRLAEL
jgi:8-oxo-dGTP pyrophosphatase MutT (NUDIX family)